MRWFDAIIFEAADLHISIHPTCGGSSQFQYRVLVVRNGKTTLQSNYCFAKPTLVHDEGGKDIEPKLNLPYGFFRLALSAEIKIIVKFWASENKACQSFKSCSVSPAAVIQRSPCLVMRLNDSLLRG